MGLLAGAAMLAVGAVAFGLALSVVNAALGGIDMKTVAKSMGLLAIAVVASLGLAYAAVPLAAGALPAIPGLIAGSIMLAVGAWAYAKALGKVNEQMSAVDMVATAKNFGLLALAVIATVPLSAAATALLIPALIGIPGALAGALFLTVGAWAYAGALAKVQENMSKVDMLGAAKNMGFLALALIATIPLSLAAAALIVPAVLGMIGIFPAAAFLALTAKVLGPALVSFGAMGIDAKAVAKNAGAVAAAMGALVITALTAVLLIPFAVPFIGGWLMKKGISIIGKFMTMIADKLVGPLQAFAAMPIPAGAQLGKKIELINAAVDGVGTLGNIAIGLAEVDTAAVEEGGKQGGTIKAITGFMDVLLGGMVDMINAIANLAKSVPTENIGAIKAIADVITGLGKLMGGVVPPIAGLAESMMEASTEGGGLFSSGKVNTGKFDSMMNNVKGLVSGVFGVMKDQITPMITTILKIKVPAGEGTQKKVELIAKVVGIISKFLDPMSKVLEMMNKQEKKKSWWEKIVDKVMNKDPAKGIMGKLKTIMEGLMRMVKANLAPMVKTILAAAPPDAKKAEPKIKMVAAAIDIMGKMTGQLFKTLELVKGSGKKPNMKALTFLFGKPGNPKSSAMYMIASSVGDGIKLVVKAILASTKGLDAKAVEPTIKVVSLAIDSVAKFAGAIVDVMKIGMPSKAGMSSIKKALPLVLTIMYNISRRIAKDLPRVINPIIKIAQGIGGSKSTAKGMEIVASAIGAVGDFAGAIKDVMSLVPANPKKVNPKRLEDVVEIVKKVVDAIKTSLPTLVEALLGTIKKTRGVRTSSVKKLAKILEGVGHFATALNQIMDFIPKEVKGDKDLDKRLKTVSKVATAASDGMDALVGNKNSGMIKLIKLVQSAGVSFSGIKKMVAFFKGVGEFAKGLKELQNLNTGKGVKEAVTKVAEGITQATPALNNMITAISKMKLKEMGRAATLSLIHI